MNFGLAFSYVFKDPDWIKKIGFVALCQLIPILGQIVAMGFGIEIIRRLLNNDPRPLPDFDFGLFLGKGFQAFLVSMVYSIPMAIITLPIQILPAFANSGQNAALYNTLSIAVSCICGGLGFIYGLLIAFLLPASLARLADTGSMGAALKLGEIFGIVRKAFVPYLIVVLGTLVAGLIAPLGVIACVIGVLVTSVYSQVVTAHLQAQAYRQAVPV